MLEKGWYFDKGNGAVDRGGGGINTLSMHVV